MNGMADGEWGTVIYTTDETSITGGMYTFSPIPGYTDQFDKMYLGKYDISVDLGHDNVYSVMMAVQDGYWIEEVKFASTDVVPETDELRSFCENPAGVDGYPPHVFGLYNKESHFEESCLRSFVRVDYNEWDYCQADEPDCSYRRRLGGRDRRLNDGSCYRGNYILLRARICTVDNNYYEF